MGLIGCIFELVVLTCLCAGIASNAAVVGTCEMLNLRTGGNIGPWRADIPTITNGCEGWSKEEASVDWLINMARACSMMALIFGCILTFFGFFQQCLCPLPCGRILIDVSGVMVQISLALVWPMIRSNVCDSFGGCSWGDGSWALLFAQLFFFAASIFSRCMRDPRYKRNQDDSN